MGCGGLSIPWLEKPWCATREGTFFQKESPRQGSAENVLQGHRTNTPKSNDDGQATRQPRSKALGQFSR